MPPSEVNVDLRRTAALARALVLVVGLCGLGSARPAGALDMAVRMVPAFDSHGKARQRLVLSGRIVPGDVDKLLRTLVTLPPELFDGVVLDSQGGSTIEGIRLGMLLSYFMVHVIVREPYRCLSACFSMYAGAAMRSAHGPPWGSTLGVHRGYIWSDEAAKLSDRTVEALVEFEQVGQPRWLAAHGVPPHVIELIVATAVGPSIVLFQQDIDAVGARSPRYDAWIEARCPGSGAQAVWVVREVAPQVAPEMLPHATERRLCESTRVDAERRYRQSALQAEIAVADARAALRPERSGRGAHQSGGPAPSANTKP